MSWDRDRLSSTSSSSSPSSSSLPSQSRVRSTGLPSLSTIDQTDSSGERLRLPPLSSLISGSSSQYPGAALAPPQTKDVPRGAAGTADPGFSRPDWSPLAYNQGSRFPELNHSPEQQQASSPQRAEDPYRPSHHHQQLHRFHQEHGVVANEGQQQHYVASQPAYPSMQGFRRSNSTSSSSAQSVSLPPLTSLSIKTSSRSPSLASASLTDREAAASRHTPSIYSLHRSPFPPSSPSSKHSIGPARRRWTGGSSSHTPYDRPSPPTDAEHFDQIWDIYSYACRVNDEASDAIRQSYPTIAHLDLKALLHHLHRELDELDRHNPRLGMQLAQDAGLAGPIKPSHLSPTTSPASASLPYHQHGWMNAPRGGTIEGPLSASREGGGGVVGLNSSTTSYFDRGQLYRRNSRGESSSSSTTSPPLARVMPGHPSSYHQQHSLPSISPGGMKSAGVINPIYSPLAASSSSSSTGAASSLPPKRVRKRKDEAEQSCLSCSATETPEWRKGPTGPRTLCNACGLLFAKQCRKKELDAQTRGERPKGSRPIAPEIMSAEEKERSLAELKIAVNARAANVSPPI